jgi:hypothetical protein
VAAEVSRGGSGAGEALARRQGTCEGVPVRLLLVATCLVVGCTPRPGLDPLPVPEGCQPLLGGAHCLLPFPSDFFLVDDAAMPSGKRVVIPSAARLRQRCSRTSTASTAPSGAGTSSRRHCRETRRARC